MFFATNPENAAIVERLKQALVELPHGSEVAYIQLNKIAGRDVQHKARHLLAKARDEAEKETGGIFECIRTVGVRRVPADESPDIGLHSIRRVRKISRRGTRRLERINSNSLSDAGRKRVIAHRSMLGAIAVLADGNKARTLAAVADPAKPVPPADVLRMFV